jgi:hypothetical protein
MGARAVRGLPGLNLSCEPARAGEEQAEPPPAIRAAAHPHWADGFECSIFKQSLLSSLYSYVMCPTRLASR